MSTWKIDTRTNNSNVQQKNNTISEKVIPNVVVPSFHFSIVDVHFFPKFNPWVNKRENMLLGILSSLWTFGYIQFIVTIHWAAKWESYAHKWCDLLILRDSNFLCWNFVHILKGLNHPEGSGRICSFCTGRFCCEIPNFCWYVHICAFWGLPFWGYFFLFSPHLFPLYFKFNVVVMSQAWLSCLEYVLQHGRLADAVWMILPHSQMLDVVSWRQHTKKTQLLLSVFSFVGRNFFVKTLWNIFPSQISFERLLCFFVIQAGYLCSKEWIKILTKVRRW